MSERLKSAYLKSNWVSSWFRWYVRLSRLIGIDNAVEWMAMANPKKPAAALKDGAVDAVVAADKLQDCD
jgi:enoyl-CoA hydratase/carnithine racemase